MNLPSMLDHIKFEQILTRDTISQAVKWAKIAFGIGCLLLSGYAVWFLVKILIATPADMLRLEQQIAHSQGDLLEPSGKSSAHNYEPIRTSTLFGELGERTAPEATPTPAPARAVVPLALIGTFVSSPDSSVAIIEDQRNKSQEVFSVNEMVFDEARLLRIMSDRVEIERDGRREFLSIEDTRSTPSIAGSVSTAAITEEFVIDEDELNEALDNLPLLLTQARAVPYFQDGQAVGLRLFAIRSGSLYEKIGLRNGDILKTINGNSMGDISQALRLFEQLKEERSLSLVLERNRSQMAFNYIIR